MHRSKSANSKQYIVKDINQTFPGEYFPQEIHENIGGWIQKMQTTDISGLKSNETTTLFRVINLTIKDAIKITFYFVSIIFFVGFITSLFTRSSKESERNILLVKENMNKNSAKLTERFFLVELDLRLFNVKYTDQKTEIFKLNWIQN